MTRPVINGVTQSVDPRLKLDKNGLNTLKCLELGSCCKKRKNCRTLVSVIDSIGNW